MYDQQGLKGRVILTGNKAMPTASQDLFHQWSIQLVFIVK